MWTELFICLLCELLGKYSMRTEFVYPFCCAINDSNKVFHVLGKYSMRTEFVYPFCYAINDSNKVFHMYSMHNTTTLMLAHLLKILHNLSCLCSPLCMELRDFTVVLL